MRFLFAFLVGSAAAISMRGQKRSGLDPADAASTTTEPPITMAEASGSNVVGGHGDVTTSVDIAVVGGGISGAYAAWRLKTDRGDLDVSLFERTDRFGGRFLSPAMGCENAAGAKETNLPRAEIGGMRIRAHDILMHKLAQQVDVELSEFYLNSEDHGPTEDGHNPIFINGEVFTRSEAEEIMKNGTAGEKFKFLLDAAVNKVDPKAQFPYYYNWGLPVDKKKFGFKQMNTSGDFDPCNSNNWKATTQTISMPKNDVLRQNISLNDLSSTALNTLFGGVGWQGEHVDSAIKGYFGVGGFSANHEVYVSDDVRDNSAGYTRPLKGMQELPLATVAAFRDANGEAHTNLELTSIITLPEGSARRLQLTFRKTVTDSCTHGTYMDPDATPITVYADKVVLAGLPKDALGGLTSALPPSVTNAFTDLQYTIRGARYSKYFVAFDTQDIEDLWGKVRPKATKWKVGRYTTDLSSQQAFRWFPGTQGRSDNPAQICPGCNLTVFQFYDENPAVSFVQPNKALSSDHAVCAHPDYAIPDVPLGIMLNDFAVMLGVKSDDIPKVQNTKMMYWGPDSVQSRSYAFHTWNSGVEWWNVFEQALQPSAVAPVFVIGEAFSVGEQGWGEGSLQSAEYMLQEKIGLKPPKWLSEHEYCYSNMFWPSERRNYPK